MTPGLAVPRLLDKLEQVTPSGATWSARCPAHQDRHPSLSISEGDDGRVLIHCHAGCSAEAVCDAIGLTSADLFVQGAHPAGLGPIIAAYPYTDVEGALLFEVVRFEPKRFRQRRPNGQGGWSWNRQGVKPVLYRLPEVMEAVRDGDPVYVVEGEKDADALARLGFCATCNPGGAGKWRPEFSEPFRGAPLVRILPDADSAGRNHAAKVAGALQGIATRVEVVELPDSPATGDVSDWIADCRREGLESPEIAHRLHRLQGESFATYGETSQPMGDSDGVVCMADVEPEAVRFLWEPYIPAGKLTILEGDPGEGKTTLALAVTAALSRGRGLPCGADFEPASVLYLTAEDGLADTLRPRLDAAEADCLRVFARPAALDLSTAEGLAALKADIEEYWPALVILDPIQAYGGGKTDFHRVNEVRAVLAPLSGLAEETGVAILAIRHLTKTAGGKPLYRGQGSIDFAAAARSVLLVGSDDSGGTIRRALVQTKCNVAAKGPTQAFTLDAGRFLWAGESTLTAGDLLKAEQPHEERSRLEEAREFLRQELADGEVSATEVLAAARAEGIAERTLYTAKKREGIKKRREGYGRGGKWFWSLPTPDGAIGCKADRPAINATYEGDEVVI